MKRTLTEQRYEEPPVHKNGFWIGESPHYYCPKFSNALVGLIKRWGLINCYDFGCGDGAYVDHFNSEGIDSFGYDGNPFYIGEKMALHDLTKPLIAPKREVVLSIEVGEHIPAEFEDQFLANLINHASRRIILSWAIPKQEGHGHVNCHTNDWVKGKMALSGWVYDAAASEFLRRETDLWWLKKTVMVFANFD